MSRVKVTSRLFAYATLISILSACSDMGSNADIEVLQKHDTAAAEVRLIETETERRSLREALEDPRLHPYALARTIFAESDFRQNSPMFLLQFAAALIDSETAPEIVDREVDNLLAAFDDISRLQPYFAQNEWTFYLRLLRVSQFTPNTERTKQLRDHVEDLFELHIIDDNSRARLVEFYLEQDNLLAVERHLEQIDEPYYIARFSLILIERYLQRDDRYAAQRLLDELSLMETELLGFTAEWVSVLLLANRESQAVTFVLDGFDRAFSALYDEDQFTFYRNIISFNELVQQALRLERADEARDALLRAYRQLASFSGLELINVRLSIPFLKAFATLGDESTFAEVKRDVLARTYSYLQNPDYFTEVLCAFSAEMLDQGLEQHAIELIDIAAKINDDEVRIPEPEFHYALGYAYGMLGEEERGQRHLQALFNDPTKLDELLSSWRVSPFVVIQDFIDAGYVDEAISLVGTQPSMTEIRVIFGALVAEERFVEALQKLGEYNLNESSTVWGLLTIGHGYLSSGMLPNAEARAVMQDFWSRYMPTDS